MNAGCTLFLATILAIALLTVAKLGLITTSDVPPIVIVNGFLGKTLSPIDDSMPRSKSLPLTMEPGYKALLFIVLKFINSL
ncbi:hypothetical protein SDC9_149471 [bioreactor metagenome]|uniref:Uncharacterized protein n=1 Tax=bioreactor metagenome TaxID=1076179 RepID=A0A645EKF6_9ZZZZ